MFSPPQSARSTELSAAALFKLLGWIFAEEGRKCMPFDARCEALGVVFDLAASVDGVCHVTNTESRVQEISPEINRLIEQGQVFQLEAQKLRGRMQFAESQIFGRTGRRCIAALREFACRRKSKLTEPETTFLQLFVSQLKADIPRQVLKEQAESVVLIADACFEKESRERICGLGGVLVDVQTGMRLFFSCELDEEQRSLLGERSKKQIIFEAESLCAVLAYNLWPKFLEGRKCFLYVENEGTEFSLIKGKSDKPCCRRHCWRLCWDGNESENSMLDIKGELL